MIKLEKLKQNPGLPDVMYHSSDLHCVNSIMLNNATPNSLGFVVLRNTSQEEREKGGGGGGERI